MNDFTEAEKKILKNYVTDTEGDIYAIKNLSGIVGAVYARYSRARTGFRETLLKEFVKEGNLNPEKADKLIQRVLIQFGDDSVGELEGGHVAFENISMIATKEIEDRRIGGSPIEKSTRYVWFDQKDKQGNYPYVKVPEIMSSKYANKYIKVMNFIFDTYVELIKPMQNYYKRIFPLASAEYDILGTGQKQKIDDLKNEQDRKAFMRTYKIDIKTKACDSLRCLLPLSTKTNVGLFGNGRFWQMLISHLLSTDFIETKELGNKTFTELSKIIPQYVRRAKKRDYNININQAMRKLVLDLFAKIKINDSESVTLMPPEMRNTEEFLLANMLYPYLQHPFVQIYEVLRQMNSATKNKIKQTYIGDRKNRRDRPGRAFEAGYTYTIDLMADFGTYKDLMRHRMNTQQRQLFSPIHGMVVPADIIQAGLENKVMECHQQAFDLFIKIYQDLGDVACYVALHGSKVRWLMGFNDREAMHLLELRTTPQGHPQYRKLSQQIHNEIQKQYPWRAEMMKFVDHNDYQSARGDSEARQRVKENKLDNNS